MYEDTPQELVHDLIARGRLRLAPARAARDRHRRGDLVRVTARARGPTTARCTRRRTSSSPAAGNIDARPARRARRSGRVAPAHGARRRRRPASARRSSKTPKPGLRFQRKDTEQYHVCLGAPGVSRSDRRRFAASILDAILGGSASSRLFQEIREKRGMAYAVYSFLSQYADTGQIGIYVGTREDNLAEALAIARRADRRHRRRQPARRASSSARRRTSRAGSLLSMESTSTRMNRLGKSLVTDTEILSLDRIVAEIDAVDAEAVARASPASCSRRSGSRPQGSGRARSASSRRSSARRPRSRARREDPAQRLRAALARDGQGRRACSGRRSSRPATSSSRTEAEAEAMVDFTAPDAVVPNILRALAAGVPVRRRHERLGPRRGRRRGRARRACRSSTRRTSRSAPC